MLRSTSTLLLLACAACSSSERTDCVVEAPGATIVEARAAEGLCAITGRIDGTIGFELLLPADWNGKLLMGGGGGFVGSTTNQAQWLAPDLLERGYATIATDTGHRGTATDASWALGDANARENFAHRAVHRTLQVGVELIESHYDAPVERRYFIGCSRGGGQALIAAQRYPEDFDGLVALAPVLDWTAFAADGVQNAQALDGAGLGADDLQLLAGRLELACAEELATDPRDCDFDPSSLSCERSAEPCLDDAELDAVRAIYSGIVIDGREVYPGFPFGGENDEGGWERWVTGGRQLAYGEALFRYFVFDDPSWDYRGYDFSNWREEVAATAELLNATDPDLSDFDGKVILAHGWSDAALTALATIDYHDRALALDPDLHDRLRLFLLPRVGHCGGGPGADTVDWLGALERWVERGEAPDRLVATSPDGSAPRTLEPYQRGSLIAPE